jgi:hypothetical protein
MSGRSRLPSGEPRRASQRYSRPAAASSIMIRSAWRAGDRVQWRDRVGIYQRDLGEGLVDIDIAGRTYRVLKTELRPPGQR